MAIDFMIMPLSRYIAGDFVTPLMHWSWAQGVPYVIFGADGKREFPPGMPFGGAGATTHRASILGMLAQDLSRLQRPISSSLWDESSNAEPQFHRVEPHSYGVLLEHAATPKKSFWRSKRKTAEHLTSRLFLPCDFEVPFEMTDPLLLTSGSTPRALQELESTVWPEDARHAVETLGSALADAAALRFPLIVDL